MIQKAIIEQKIDKYSMKVRIPVYNKVKSDPTATPLEELYTASIQTLPGCSPNYQEGDIVLVDFENDNISLPIIVGLLYREDMPKGSTDVTADSLTVNVNTNLSENTLIGAVTPESIKKLNDKYTNNVKNVVVEYSLSNYRDHYEQFSQWSQQAPQYWPDKYMWQRTTVTYENGMITRSMTCIQGASGEPGSAITIVETSVLYAVGSRGDQHPSTSSSGVWFENPPAATDVNPYLWSWTYVLYSDGSSTDTFSVSKAAPNSMIVYLYKRSRTTISQVDWTNTLVFSFDTKEFVTPPGIPTGWYADIPPGDNPIYVTAATASSVTSTANIPYTSWATPILFTKSGFNSETVHLYRRYNSVPDVPSSSVTYTFSTGALSPPSPYGWTRGIPTTDGNPCYVIQATAISYSDTETIESSEWSTPTILAQDGEADFIVDGGITDWYIATSNTNTPNSPTVNIEQDSQWTTLGWTKNISDITLSSSNKFLWNAEVTNYSISGYIKTNPHIITVYGEGQAGKGITSITEYYARSTTTQSSTIVDTWASTPYTMTPTLRYLWNYSHIEYTDGTSTGVPSDALIIGAYGDSVLSIEIQSSNGNIFNSKTVTTTLTPAVYLGTTELTVNNSGVVTDSDNTTVGQITWVASEKFIGNGTATRFDLGLDVLNANKNKVSIKVGTISVDDFTVERSSTTPTIDTIVFATAPANNSSITITYITSQDKSITINRTDVRNQILITCRVVSNNNILTFSELTIKDLNDAVSLKTWYMLTVENAQAVMTPTVIYDPNDCNVVPTGSYSYEDSGGTRHTEDDWAWAEDPFVINDTTINQICYSFTMIIFSDNSCSAGEVARDGSFDQAVLAYRQAQEAGLAAAHAQEDAGNAKNTADGNTTEITNIYGQLQVVNDELAARLKKADFTSAMQFDDGLKRFITLDLSDSDPSITLGTEGRFTQQIKGTGNYFKDGDTDVAWITNKELFISNATVDNQLNLDQQWSITFDSTNGLVIKKY